jgi:hypothetical protein
MRASDAAATLCRRCGGCMRRAASCQDCVAPPGSLARDLAKSRLVVQTGRGGQGPGTSACAAPTHGKQPPESGPKSGDRFFPPLLSMPCQKHLDGGKKEARDGRAGAERSALTWSKHQGGRASTGPQQPLPMPPARRRGFKLPQSGCRGWGRAGVAASNRRPACRSPGARRRGPSQAPARKRVRGRSQVSKPQSHFTNGTAAAEERSRGIDAALPAAQ